MAPQPLTVNQARVNRRRNTRSKSLLTWLGLSLFSLFSLGCFSTPAHATTLTKTVAGTHVATLPNGLNLIVKEDPRAPTVVHMVWYKAGSIDETNGTTGVAHVLEHMMFKGTRTIKPGEFSKRVAAMGGRENAFTSTDFTAYFQQVHKRYLPQVMALEADRMHNLVLSEKEFAQEIKVVMEERRWRTDDKPKSQLFETLMATAFTASPYHAPIVGWMSDLEAMTVADARRWYQDWYAPNNATVIVVGDVRAAEVLALAQQTYGRWPRKALPPRKPQQEPAQLGLRRVQVHGPAETPYLLMAWKVPVLRDIEQDNDVYALSVLSAILDGYEGARLTANLVRNDKIALNAGASYDSTARGPALFYLDGSPAPGKTVADLEQALRAQITQIAQQGIREEELQRVKAQLIAARVYKQDSNMGQAMEIMQLEMTGIPHTASDRLLEKIRAVTPAQVQAVARNYFIDAHLTIGELVPEPIDPANPSKTRAKSRPNFRH
ncbi:insulinase family protein [Parvibium lacunae]|uniref:Insulinase family protein n=2 Tax=Parvibium lacunae TaxID=1888893 RepID=A0A368L0M0_9BURK|nr:insulinase family protein [Parvibium lacunae]